MLSGWKSEIAEITSNTRTNIKFGIRWHKPIETFLGKYNYMPTFKVQWQIYHRAGSLLQLPDADHKFLQIYFMRNTDEQIDQCSDSILALNDKLSLYYKLYWINTTNEYKHLQFPVLLAFAMTINKARNNSHKC